MLVFPNAKINLGLNVIAKRKDGYHDIETGMHPLPVCDVLEIVEAESFSFESMGLKIPGDKNDNMCVRAFELLQDKVPPVRVILFKNIPMRAGLGGGSADGAFTLKLLNKMFKLGLGDKELEKLALGLGSDCPFFIKNQPALVKGRGEQLDANYQSWYLDAREFVVVCPDIHVSTAEAYKAINPEPHKIAVEGVLNRFENYKEELKNDFEEFVFKKEPVVGLIKDELYGLGAAYASMSGSGSAVFGLFDKQPDLANKFTEHKIFSGTL